MNSFLLVCDVFLFVFWENPRPEKKFRDLLTFSAYRGFSLICKVVLMNRLPADCYVGYYNNARVSTSYELEIFQLPCLQAFFVPKIHLKVARERYKYNSRPLELTCTPFWPLNIPLSTTLSGKHTHLNTAFEGYFFVASSSLRPQR